MQIKETGKGNESFDTGSQRDNREEKGRFDLLPPYAIYLVAKWFQLGAKKYASRNWEKGQPLSVFLDCCMRHIFKHLAGLKDEPHDVAAAWNILALIETEHRIEIGSLPKELDDLPDYGEKIWEE